MFYSITLYKINENFSFSSNNSCSCIIIHHIFKDSCTEQWPNFQLTAALPDYPCKKLTDLKTFLARICKNYRSTQKSEICIFCAIKYDWDGLTV